MLQSEYVSGVQTLFWDCPLSAPVLNALKKEEQDRKGGETSSRISCLLHVFHLSVFGYSFWLLSQGLWNVIYNKFISDLDTTT